MRDDSKPFLVLKPAGLRTVQLPIEYERMLIKQDPSDVLCTLLLLVT